MHNDWDEFFAQAAQALWHGKSPYTVSHYFNPPWLAVLLMPLAWLPWYLAMLLPAAALILAAHHRRKWWLVPIVGLSFPFIALSLYANVDWVPLLGVAYGGAWGSILTLTKPQASGLAPLAWLRQKGIRVFLPLILVIGLCLIIWPRWPLEIFDGVHELPQETRNASLFPYSIPLGILALWLTWRKGSALWGCVASLSLTSYFYIHSLVPLLFLIADRKWWLGVLFAVGTWILVYLSITGVIGLQF